MGKENYTFNDKKLSIHGKRPKVHKH